MIELSFSLVPSYPLARYVDVIAQAAGQGFDRLWLTDQGFHRDPFIALATVGVRVDALDLGMAVTTVFTRHPVQIARAAAALGELRPGGLALGLGAGERRVRDAIGAADARFVEGTRDGIVAMRRLFAGETVTIQNDAFALNGVTLEFTPSIGLAIGGLFEAFDKDSNTLRLLRGMTQSLVFIGCYHVQQVCVFCDNSLLQKLILFSRSYLPSQ